LLKPEDAKIEYNPKPGQTGYRISIIVDDLESWILPWARLLADMLKQFHEVTLLNKLDESASGDFAFLLGCTKMVSGGSTLNRSYRATSISWAAWRTG